MRDFWLGIAGEHRAGLLFLLAAPLLLAQAPRVVPRLTARWRAAAPDVRAAATLLATLAIVHLGLPLATGSVPVAAACGWLAVRAVSDRSWRGASTLLVLTQLLLQATFAGVRVAAADQVTLTVSILELALLSVSARRVLARLGTVAVVVLFGVTMWLVSAGTHEHDGADRLQAGTVQRPAGPAATAAQRAAARELAGQVRAATARYATPAAAEADGYRATGAREGMQVHFAHKGHQSDGLVLDPAAPEQLVYAVRGDRALLLGAAFQMPVAGERGPEVGGDSTRWHAHDVCIGLLPPGFGIVSPYGSCPGLTFDTTFPEMIHVWVVDPPGGPYTEHLDDAWVSAKLDAA